MTQPHLCFAREISANDLELDDLEASWWIQGLQGDVAKIMGYRAAEGFDEQGTVFIVPMLGREVDLRLVRTENCTQ